MNEHPLFVALTRPPMRFGVTLTFFMLNGGFALILFVLSSSFVTALFVGLGLHLFGYFACLYEPRIFDLWLGKLQCMNCKNRQFWHCNSYDAF